MEGGQADPDLLLDDATRQEGTGDRLRQGTGRLLLGSTDAWGADSATLGDLEAEIQVLGPYKVHTALGLYFHGPAGTYPDHLFTKLKMLLELVESG